MDATPSQQVFPIFLGNGKSFSLQTKFLAIGSSLGHLSMKKFFKSDLSSSALKLDHGCLRVQNT